MTEKQGRNHPHRVALVNLRRTRGLEAKELAAKAGIPPNVLSGYETGTKRTLTREKLLFFATLIGYTRQEVDELLRWIQKAQTSPGARGIRSPAATWLQRDTENAVGDFVRETEQFSRDFLDLVVDRGRALAERQRALDQLERLRRTKAVDRRRLVEQKPECWTPALCQLLCDESIRAAADNADRAVEWAELAVAVAERVPGDKASRQGLEGFALGHLGNGRRVQGKLPTAKAVFLQARPLWEAGAEANLGNLNAARFLGLEASWRREQRQLPEALALLEEALAIDRWGERGNLLLNKSKVLEEQGDYKGAIAALTEAEPLLQGDCEPRSLCVLKSNRPTFLCHLERYAEADALMPEVRRLAAELNNELDLVRLRWLEGRLGAGLGQAKEALAMLEGVRQDFLTRNIAYDAALVTMEMAVLHLEAGQTGEVKALAREMAPIFEAQQVHREALAALLLFRKAVEQDAATAALARRVVKYLYRARHDPELRFEDFAG
jgi:tetratricopeptide (TPR) repeat protein